ncbi:MAG: dihydrofolate reductase family protein, partial [Marinirhabdus sp.]|nr:dihydrofolate reductase family protein [Marinirhabdus sp.]
IRFILDKTLRTPVESSIFDDTAQTFILSEANDSDRNGVEIIPIKFTKQLGQQICDLLAERAIQSLIVEGGAKTLQTFIDENLWDEALIFKGEAVLKEGIEAPNITTGATFKTQIGSDTFIHIKNNLV